MAETRALSQWEIDNLLNQIPDATSDGGEVTSGGPPSPLRARDRGVPRVIKAYDFRRPDKFSKEQWHTLTAMHETFARMIGAQFSSRMRTLITVRLSSIDQGLYEEWQSQVPGDTTCYVMSMQPLAGSIVVEFNQDVAGDVVDRLLGGNALIAAAGRELSDIELVLLRTFAGAITASLREMWTNVTPVTPEVQELGTDASLIQVAGANDVVVTAFFEVNLGNRLGAMSICTPYTVLEQVASKLLSQVWLAQGLAAGGTDQTRRTVRALLGTAPLELAVELGATDVPARSITELREGDTLVLDARVDRALPVLLGGHVRFLCRPGMVGNRIAVRVSDVVEQYPGYVDEDAGVDTQRSEADAVSIGVPIGAPAGGEGQS